MPTRTHQFFTHMGTDKAGATEYQDVFHAVNLTVFARLHALQGQSCRQTAA
jgi:hypothetical protein